MTAKEILKLIDAGFTKEDIFKLEGTAPDRAGSEAPEDKKDPEDLKPETKPEPAPAPVQTSGVTLSDDQFTKLLQQLNVQGASLDVPPDQDIASKLGEHFKNLVIGK